MHIPAYAIPYLEAANKARAGWIGSGVQRGTAADKRAAHRVYLYHLQAFHMALVPVEPA